MRDAFEALKQSRMFKKWRRTQRLLQRDRCFYEPISQDVVWASACVGSLLGHGAYHVDHVMPLCLGGRNKLSNFVLSCSNCNRRKRDSRITNKLFAKCLSRLAVLEAVKPPKLKRPKRKKEPAIYTGPVNWNRVFATSKV